MLKAYYQQNGGLKGIVVADNDPVPPNALWVDLLDPTAEERRKVDETFRLEIPTRADMEEIEISSRLYSEGETLYMTSIVLAHTESEAPQSGAVTFVLAAEHLITIRYIDPQPFRTFALRCERGVVSAPKPEMILLQIIDNIVDRMADILEKAGTDVETVSRGIFEPAVDHVRSSKDFQNVLRELGRKYDLTSKMRESLLTIGRMVAFITQSFSDKAHKDSKAHLKTLARDVLSLQDHSSFISNKLTFLLDATLGLINIEQNNVIKIMSVAAIVFLPPTLVASIYGMNFIHMPELDEWWGYPFAIFLMVLSGFTPYYYFKRRGWL